MYSKLFKISLFSLLALTPIIGSENDIMSCGEKRRAQLEMDRKERENPPKLTIPVNWYGQKQHWNISLWEFDYKGDVISSPSTNYRFSVNNKLYRSDDKFDFSPLANGDVVSIGGKILLENCNGNKFDITNSLTKEKVSSTNDYYSERLMNAPLFFQGNFHQIRAFIEKFSSFTDNEPLWQIALIDGVNIWKK
jgi:hypothetical protein